MGADLHEPGAQQERDGPAAAPPAVLAAVELGWCMAELYATVKPAALEPPQAPEEPEARDAPGAPLPKVSAAAESRRIQLQEDLPGLGSLQAQPELQLLIDRVNVGYHHLELVISHAGLAVAAPQDWASLTYQRASPEGRYQLARSVLQFHTDLLVALTACDHQVGLAYGLGRAVADLSMRPCANSQASLTDDLRSGRVKTIVGWLRELHTVLPAHSAGAVVGSITQWQQWAADPSWHGAPLDWDAHGDDVVGALGDQGKRWRLLLTGQIAALDQLSSEDYVQAAGYMVGRIREILQRLLAQYWPWVMIITLAMVAAVVSSLVLLHSPTAKGIGVAISVFGWLGVTGRSVSGQLQRTVSHVEQSLWDSELDLAAAWATTMLPDADADRQLHEAQAPRSPFGQSASRLVVRRRQTPEPPADGSQPAAASVGKPDGSSPV
jgi:cell division inhibitor SulA